MGLVGRASKDVNVTIVCNFSMVMLLARPARKGQPTDFCKDSSGRMQLIDKSAILDVFPRFEVKVDVPNLAG
jgi:hypothetical protein